MLVYSIDKYFIYINYIICKAFYNLFYSLLLLLLILFYFINRKVQLLVYIICGIILIRIKKTEFNFFIVYLLRKLKV